ncbi:hypothetical protein H261_00735 [Paramagnetospirillum caucaseum]|uniref:DUF2946 domain-containing protein n=1 Tax=Paramagnetospirillum caucaseum TaxID=1244869 RepID=M2ZCA3_9PROT|nr:hypothetical protein [Paramagnetospirillum caucaseum]EME72060.1 hypothetical protein H261_00735 [Paramagnetospirillum caucaseum]
MRDVLSRLLRLGLPALLLVAAAVLWSGGAQAGEGMHHHDGAHAAPCHEQAAEQSRPAAGHIPAGHGCPDCLCLTPGCGSASAALPLMAEASPLAFTLAPPQAAAPARLVTQALTGPPAEPPRL